MAAELKGKRVAILATDGVEQIELSEPRRALEEAGARVDVIAPHDGEILTFVHRDSGVLVHVDATLEHALPADYDALMLPGGVVNADHLRIEQRAVEFVRDIVRSGKSLAVICHGAWALVEADVVRGITLTSYPSLRTDIRNAGGNWVDREVVVDRGIVSSRRPADLPAFNAAMIAEIAAGRANRAMLPTRRAPRRRPEVPLPDGMPETR
jgi:protease I